VTLDPGKYTKKTELSLSRKNITHNEQCVSTMSIDLLLLEWQLVVYDLTI